MIESRPDGTDAARTGVIAALVAYVLWGIFPVYFKLVANVAPTEVLAHRIVWSLVFGGLIVALRRQWKDVYRAVANTVTLRWLALSASMISVNWLTYIWAIQNERIFETSLGYYINPLLYVLAGVVLFRDRLRALQLVAVVLAAIGVLVLTFSGGAVPYVALLLGVTFTLYGVIRKKVVIGAMPGLFVETVLLFPLAFLWLGYLVNAGEAAFASGSGSQNALLLLAGPFTVVPLLCFAIAARRLTLTTIGFMQFIAPTLQFGTGLYYGEQLTTAHVVCFAFIWTAVAVFSTDAIRAGRKKPPPVFPVKA